MEHEKDSGNSDGRLLPLLAACSGGQRESVQETENSSASADVTEDGRLLAGIAGRYQELFPVLYRDEYRQIWLDNCAAVVGEADADGKEAFRHEYRFTGTDENTGMYVFESADADAGEFACFCFAPDTLAETYHIEFRYGSDRDSLFHFDAGPYAYWMAAGIPVDCDRSMIENCIALFCAENLAG